MATIKLGGRELQVRPATLGFVKRKLLPWRERLKTATSDTEVIDRIVEGLLLYLGHNEGVTEDWLLDNAPHDAQALLARVREVAGHEASTGEALSP